MDQMDTRFEILFKLLPLLDTSTAVLPEVKILSKPTPMTTQSPKRTQFDPKSCVNNWPKT